jgi:hypothetical protein
MLYHETYRTIIVIDETVRMTRANQRHLWRNHIRLKEPSILLILLQSIVYKNNPSCGQIFGMFVCWNLWFDIIFIYFFSSCTAFTLVLGYNLGSCDFYYLILGTPIWVPWNFLAEIFGEIIKTGMKYNFPAKIQFKYPLPNWLQIKGQTDTIPIYYYVCQIGTMLRLIFIVRYK